MSDTFTFAQFLAALEAVLPKAECGWYSSQSQQADSVFFGYSTVHLPKSPSLPVVVSYRREGTPLPEARKVRHSESSRSEPLTSLSALAAFAADVMRTGRTVECGPGVGLNEIRKRASIPRHVCGDYRPGDLLRHLTGRDERGEEVELWDLNPDYQRGHVWTDQQAELFLGHMLEGGSVPYIWAQRFDKEENLPPGYKCFTELPHPVEIIDGQQRLRAVARWMTGEIPGEVSTGERIWYKDTNEVERRGLPTLKVAFVDLPRAERLRFYLKLNSGGTIHTDEEIDKVRRMLAEEREGTSDAR